MKSKKEGFAKEEHKEEEEKIDEMDYIMGRR